MTGPWAVDGYSLARLVFQRGLAFIYLIAFVNAANQFTPLVGQRGLLPVSNWVKLAGLRDSPSLFLFLSTDAAFTVAAWTGAILSCVALVGLSERGPAWISALVWALLYLLYLSFVNAGQVFYGFGWESILLEAGIYAVFLGGSRTRPQFLTLLLLRWLCFRVMFGAGLIKLRGDPCWRDMTCLNYFYETQPMPNPLSWFFHWGPEWTHAAGVWFNHFAELVAPFGYFLPQPIASIAGVVTILFQGTIMATGNLSWLNLLTIVLAIPTLDDRFLRALVPVHVAPLPAPGLIHKSAVVALTVLVAWLSVRPVRNMLSPQQIMNTSFNPFHLVGTYGAFGSITRTRYEIVVEGTDADAASESSTWREYEFRGKPTATGRMPPQVAPYHLRLDWLMWFAAMSPYYDHPWFVHFVAKLLEGDRAVLGLLRSNPFPDRPPRYVRARLFEYHFTTPDERRNTGQWWRRQLVGSYFPAVSLSDPAFRRVLESQGWLDEPVQQ